MSKKSFKINSQTHRLRLLQSEIGDELEISFKNKNADFNSEKITIEINSIKPISDSEVLEHNKGKEIQATANFQDSKTKEITISVNLLEGIIRIK